jgi:hypothetical protein
MSKQIDPSAYTFLKQKSKRRGRKTRNRHTVRMKQLGYKLHNRRLVWIFFREFQGKPVFVKKKRKKETLMTPNSTPESPIRKRSSVRTKDHSMPPHNVIVCGTCTDTNGRIFLDSLEITQKTTTRRSRHFNAYNEPRKIRRF